MQICPRQVLKLATLVCLFLLTATSRAAAPVSAAPGDASIAAEDPTTCETIQVLMVIDHSLSMDSNDDDDLRVWAPLNVADILAQKYLNAPIDLRAGRIAKRIQFAAVLFGGIAPPDWQLDWTTIAPTDQETWSDQRQLIAQKLTPGKFLGDTSFKNAFNAASTLWQRAEQPTNGCVQRLMLLLTDGGAFDPFDPTDDGETDRIYAARYMKGVEDILKDYLDDGGLLFVTGIQDKTGDDNIPYWDNWGPHWEKVTRTQTGDPLLRAAQVSTQEEIGKRVADIVLNTLGDATTRVPVGRLVVPPYLQSLLLAYYKPDAQDFLILSAPDGMILSPDSPDPVVIVTGADTAIQRLEVLQPLPGEYTLTTSLRSEDVTVTMQIVFARAELVGPLGPMQRFTTGQIQFRLVDNNGQPMRTYSDARYQLHVDGEVIGSVKTTPLSILPLDNGIYQADLTPVSEGVHTLQISATASDDDNRVWSVLEPANASSRITPLPAGVEPVKTVVGQFNVDGVSIKVGTSSSGETRPGCPELVQFRPFQVPLQVFNAATGESTNVNVPITWDVQAQDSSGQRVNVEVLSGTGGSYALQATPAISGAINFNISAKAPDPQDGTLYEFFKTDFRVEIEPGARLTFRLIEFRQEAEPWIRSIEQLLDSSISENKLLIGRSLFVFQREISVDAVVEQVGDAPAVTTEQLPALVFVSAGGGSKVPAGVWRNATEANHYTSTTLLPALGDYEITFGNSSAPCTVETLAETPYPSIRLVPDWLERIVTVAVILALVVLISRIVWWLLICVLGQLDGYIRLTYGKRHRDFPLKCQRDEFRIEQPDDWFYIQSIQVRSFFGSVTYTITRVDPKDMKPLEPISQSHNRNEPFSWTLGPTCELRWVKSDKDR
jgi:hypothetical protein